MPGFFVFGGGMHTVDLYDVAHVTRIPVGTLRRWAMEWPEHGKRGRRKLYEWDTVEAAVRKRQAA